MVPPEQDFRSYFCNCYGTVDLKTADDSTTSVTEYHQAFWADKQGENAMKLSPARAINHTDEELEFLAGLVNQRTAWQISGKKGVKSGYPADPTGRQPDGCPRTSTTTSFGLRLPAALP